MDKKKFKIIDNPTKTKKYPLLAFKPFLAYTLQFLFPRIFNAYWNFEIVDYCLTDSKNFDSQFATLIEGIRRKSSNTVDELITKVKFPPNSKAEIDEFVLGIFVEESLDEYQLGETMVVTNETLRRRLINMYGPSYTKIPIVSIWIVLENDFNITDSYTFIGDEDGAQTSIEVKTTNFPLNSYIICGLGRNKEKSTVNLFQFLNLIIRKDVNTLYNLDYLGLHSFQNEVFEQMDFNKAALDIVRRDGYDKGRKEGFNRGVNATQETLVDILSDHGLNDGEIFEILFKLEDEVRKHLPEDS